MTYRPYTNVTHSLTAVPFLSPVPMQGPTSVGPLAVLSSQTLVKRAGCWFCRTSTMLDFIEGFFHAFLIKLYALLAGTA